jgi:hypothetical protein
MDALARLRPPLALGERVSLRLVEPARDLIGFVTALDPLTLEDRHARLHVVDGAVLAIRRVGPALGRDPRLAPRALLDELAAHAGVTAGEPELHRISDLLAGRPAPAEVFAERGSWASGDLRARVEGEWLTTNVRDPELLTALAWWASRQNARSVQVR